MPYGNVIDRADASPLIPEDVSREIIQSATEQTAVLRLFRRVTMGRAQQRMPVLSALPTAYFVNGDTGLKQTTEMAWANKFLNVEEIACIVPIPDNVVDDADYDLWGEVRPRIEEAFARVLDAAVFFGTGAPGTWPTAVRAAALAAGNQAIADSTNAQGGIGADLDEAISLVEDDGFDPNGYVADRRLRGRARRHRNAQGDRQLGGFAGDFGSYDGDPVVYTMSGLWPQAGGGAGGTLAFVGDWSQFVAGVRQDITFTVHTEGVVTDNTGAIIYNLMQQDMTALRCKMRVAWQVANPLTLAQPNAAARYPAAELATPVVA